MTVKEFYEHCKADGAEDFEIFSAYISSYGCYIGEKKRDESDIVIDQRNKEVHI